MTWLITGSVAARHWFSDFRQPTDIDLLTPASIKTSNSSECIIDTSWHNAAQLIMDHNTDKVFLDANLLFTLKVSHAHWNVWWDKTMFDIDFFKKKQCTLNETVYKALLPVWSEIHGAKKVNLNQTVADFFDDAVVRRFDHEALHRLAAYNGPPMHEHIRPDLGRAWCSRAMFEALPAEQQYETCLEEIIVTSIERANLEGPAPQSKTMPAIYAGYKQLITSMTAGWFAKFLILNQKELLRDRKIKLLNKTNEVLVALKDVE